MISPAENLLCLGHEGARACFEEAWVKNRLPPVWLFVGPEGVGKRTLAYDLIRFLFGKGQDISPHTPFVRRLAANSHGDFFLLQEPNIEEVRNLRTFLTRTAVEGKVRLALLPCVDRLSPSATNALLKTLEEPVEHTFFFLTTESQGALLPTLRSRCRIVVLSPLEVPHFSSHLKTLCHAHRLPLPSASEIQSLWERTEGCLGKALKGIAQGDGADQVRLQHIISLGMLPEDHPEFQPPFFTPILPLWTDASNEKIAQAFQNWVQNFFVQSVSSSSGIHQQIWEQKTPLEWGQLYERMQKFLEEAQVFKSDPLHSAITAFAILKGGC